MAGAKVLSSQNDAFGKAVVIWNTVGIYDVHKISGLTASA